MDRAQLAVGLDPSSPPTTLLHMAHITGLQTSADLGESWGPIVTWAEGGFAHHPATGTGGEVYITYADFDDRIILQRSFDGGTTLGPAIDVAIRMDTWGTQDGSRFPGRFRVAPLPYLASSPIDLDIFVREITVGGLIFADGFESGDTSAWSSSESSLDSTPLIDKRDVP